MNGNSPLGEYPTRKRQPWRACLFEIMGAANRAEPPLDAAAWRVLAAVIALTLGHAKREDNVYVGVIAREARVSERHTRTVLRKLASVSLIEWTPRRGLRATGEGRVGRRSTVRVPSPENLQRLLPVFDADNRPRRRPAKAETSDAETGNPVADNQVLKTKPRTSLREVRARSASRVVVPFESRRNRWADGDLGVEVAR